MLQEVTAFDTKGTALCVIVTVMEPFGTWLNEELNKRGWSMSELGRRCNVTHATISRIISGERNASAELCAKIARAFKVTPGEVMRRAGILNPLPAEPDERQKAEAVEIICEMTEEERKEWLRYGRFIVRSRQPPEVPPTPAPAR